MRKTILFILSLVVSLSTFAMSVAGGADTLRILAIGNSFSQDAVNENFGELAIAAGHHVIVGNLYIGGCSLERHYNNISNGTRDYNYQKRIDDKPLVNNPGQPLSTGLLDEPWDIVTFQQASAFSGQAETFEPYLAALVEYVRKNVPSAGRLMWHQTWTYMENSAHMSMVNRYGSQKNMYDAICTVSQSVCEKYGMEIIPCGTAIQDLKSSYEANNCHRDGSHLSYTVGRYTAACTWFEAVFGESVLDNTYDHPDMPQYRSELARHAAHFAVLKPYALTNMKKNGFSRKDPVYDEALVPPYELPDALLCNDGTRVRNKRLWESRRRAEIFSLFETECFGKAPAAPKGMHFEVVEENGDAFGGKAIRRQVKIWLTDKKFKRSEDAYIDLLVYIPKNVPKAPAFLGINFTGNYGVDMDPEIIMPEPKSTRWGIYNSLERGASRHYWPIEEIINAGYAVATFYRGDASPDFDNSFNLGVHRYVNEGRRAYPAPDQWATVAAWAWSLSRAMDYLETDTNIDSRRVAVIGHSRLGKTALWAGACDPRFAMVISNDSGCCGAALSRRRIGETVEAINLRFPHWFCGNFKKYNGREDELPFDQHELLDLIAPRPLYVASASEDQWADPVGEGLALEEARKVYALYGKKALERLGRHVREGKHAITPKDWRHYIGFADKYLK